jgi:hypothetical protein
MNSLQMLLISSNGKILLLSPDKVDRVVSAPLSSHNQARSQHNHNPDRVKISLVFKCKQLSRIAVYI